MSVLFNIKDSMMNKISYGHIIVFLATLPFDRFYSEVVLGSLVIHTLIHWKYMNFRQLNNRKILLLQAVYLITLVSTIYTTDILQAFSDWVRQLAILLFPVLLFVNPIDLKKYRTHFLLAFSMACTIAVIYLYADALRTIAYYHLPLKTLFSSLFINHNFSIPIDIHASYLSLYLVISLIALLDLFMQRRSAKQKFTFAVCLFILLAGLMQLSSRSVFIAFLIFISFVAPVYYFSPRLRARAVAGGVVFSLLLLLIINKVEVFRERFWTGIEYDLSSTDHKQKVSDPRIERWALAWELSKQSPWIGYGSGSEVRVLGKAYFEHGLFNSFVHRLNAHNQYLSFVLKSGFLALLLYLLVLGQGLKYAISKKDIHFAGFMLLVIVVSFGENILDANKGIFFYSFFFSFFIAQHYKTPIKKAKKRQMRDQKILFNTEPANVY